VQQLLRRLRERAQRSCEGARSTEVAQLRRERPARTEPGRRLELEETFERRSAENRRAHARGEGRSAFDDPLRRERSIAVPRAHPRDPLQPEILVDERTHELVDHPSLGWGSCPTQQELSKRGVVPRCRPTARQELSRLVV
jgi:hypothetical protein